MVLFKTIIIPGLDYKQIKKKVELKVNQFFLTTKAVKFCAFNKNNKKKNSDKMRVPLKQQQ